MANKSLIDCAFEVLSDSAKPIQFKELFDKAYELSGLNLSESELKSKLSPFYTQLTLDARFVCLSDRSWDIRSRHAFEKVHIDTEALFGKEDDEEVEIDAEELEEISEEDFNEENEDSKKESEEEEF